MINLVAPKRRRPENIVPMINVAFLLLIFFLMTAVIAPSDPVVIATPDGQGEQGQAADHTILIEADGTLWVDGLKGVQLTSLSDRPVLLRADKALPAPDLATVLSQLRRAGVREVVLEVARP